MSFSSPLDARQFLVNKIIAQTVRTGVRPSDMDRRMLLLNLDDPKSVAGIPAAVLEDASRTYQNRIIHLLKSAYERDRGFGGERQKYHDALETLAGTKHYMRMIASLALRQENKASNLVVYLFIGLATAGILLLLVLWTRSK